MANNGSIVMTPEELRSSARSIDGNRDTIVNTLAELDSTINSVTAGWKGASQCSFLESYEEMKKILANFPDVLEGISTQLKTSAQIMEDADNQLAQSLHSN
jgi:WXG100 family type VII secretion target